MSDATSIARILRCAALAVLPCLVLQPARAETLTTCAKAMQSIQYHPDIAASSMVAQVVTEWQSLDTRTQATGHPPITARMVQTPAVMNALTQECTNNPGQSLQAAAGIIYSMARQSFDGF